MIPRGALLLSVLLASCGLQPVYSSGGRGPAAATLADIAVQPIPERAGFLVRSALRERFGATAETPRYRLEVELRDEILGYGLRGDNSIARERRSLRARYRLIEVGSGAVVLDDVASSDGGIDRVSSDYAVVAAETTALERLAVEIARQITAKIALAAKDRTLSPSRPRP